MMKNFSAVTLARFSFIGLIVLALTVTLPAQVQNGQYQGTVLDQSGAAVPNATVTATEQGTGQGFKATTSQTGFYVIPQLPVGQYTVKVEASGFKTESSKNQTVNGVSNKGLSGGNVNQPIEDTVQEFQQLSLNLSAQYGNSAGSITNLVTKSGTNSFHGSIFEFIRNDVLDANFFFNNQAGLKK